MHQLGYQAHSTADFNEHNSPSQAPATFTKIFHYPPSALSLAELTSVRILNLLEN